MLARFHVSLVCFSNLTCVWDWQKYHSQTSQVLSGRHYLTTLLKVFQLDFLQFYSLLKYCKCGCNPHLLQFFIWLLTADKIQMPLDIFFIFPTTYYSFVKGKKLSTLCHSCIYYSVVHVMLSIRSHIFSIFWVQMINLLLWSHMVIYFHYLIVHVFVYIWENCWVYIQRNKYSTSQVIIFTLIF